MTEISAEAIPWLVLILAGFLLFTTGLLIGMGVASNQFLRNFASVMERYERATQIKDELATMRMELKGMDHELTSVLNKADQLTPPKNATEAVQQMKQRN